MVIPILSMLLSKKRNYLLHLQKRKKTALDILLGLGGNNDSDVSESVAELEEFLLEKSVPCNSNVMAWWNIN